MRTWLIHGLAAGALLWAAGAVAQGTLEDAAEDGNFIAESAPISVRNTLRYQHAWRMQQPDPLIANNGSVDQGDALFDRHDAIAQRVDWLGEMDWLWRDGMGLRVSAAAWFDGAYGGQGRSNPVALPSAAPSYANNQFTPYVRRYYRGPSGEFLDAFVFANWAVSDTAWSVKAGRHAVVWGESLFGGTHAITYGQTPVDGMKAVANPGVSAKETALPIHQLSLEAQLTPELALLGQYLLEWRPNRVPEGGTFFGVADAVLMGPNVNRAAAQEGRAGDWGLALKWRPMWLDGTLGVYARRFDDKAGWLAQVYTQGATRAVYARGIGLWGVSLAKNVGGVALGAEVSRRINAPLTSDTAHSALDTYEGARGNTWHALLNGVLALGPSRLYDSATVSGELAWSGLDKVTSHPELYRSAATLASCSTQTLLKGCANGSYVGAFLAFTPVWLQVLPGVDLEMPVFYGAGLRGNAPTNGGGSEGAVTWKVGLTAKVQARHQIDLSYNGYGQKVAVDATSPYGSRILGAPYKDKGWLSLTFQTAF